MNTEHKCRMIYYALQKCGFEYYYSSDDHIAYIITTPYKSVPTKFCVSCFLDTDIDVVTIHKSYGEKWHHIMTIDTPDDPLDLMYALHLSGAINIYDITNKTVEEWQSNTDTGRAI